MRSTLSTDVNCHDYFPHVCKFSYTCNYNCSDGASALKLGLQQPAPVSPTVLCSSSTTEGSRKIAVSRPGAKCSITQRFIGWMFAVDGNAHADAMLQQPGM